MQQWVVSVLVMLAFFVSTPVKPSCDPAPMTLPSHVSKLFNMTLGQAQKLPEREKAQEGLRLLLALDPNDILAQTYIDYYLAQMYVQDTSQVSRRIDLLQSALATNMLSGAELQDATLTLANLFKALGQSQEAERYLSKWSQLSCDVRVKQTQAASTSKGNIANNTVEQASAIPPVQAPTRPSAPTKSNSDFAQAQSGIDPEQLLEYVEPTYPEWAFQQDVQGFVSMSLTITREGFVTDVKVLQSEPESVFDQAAIRAVRQWRFRAQRKNGRAVDKFDHRIRLEFAISPADK